MARAGRAREKAGQEAAGGCKAAGGGAEGGARARRCEARPPRAAAIQLSSSSARAATHAVPATIVPQAVDVPYCRTCGQLMYILISSSSFRESSASREATTWHATCPHNTHGQQGGRAGEARRHAGAQQAGKRHRASRTSQQLPSSKISTEPGPRGSGLHPRLTQAAQAKARGRIPAGCHHLVADALVEEDDAVAQQVAV